MRAPFRPRRVRTPLPSGNPRRRSAATLAVAALLLGACNSGHGADKAAVKKVTVQRTDLPPDWTQAPAPDPIGSEGDDSRYGECLGRPDPKTARTARQSSEEFRHGDEMRVTSTTRTMPDAAAAKADFAALAGDRGGPCLRVRITGELDRHSGAGNAPESVTVDRLPGLDFGDETVAYRAMLTYPAGDAGPKSTYVDVVNVRKATLELTVTLTSAQQPFSADLEKDVLTRVVSRI